MTGVSSVRGADRTSTGIGWCCHDIAHERVDHHRIGESSEGAFTDFPLGNTAGPPNEPETQRAIARHALGLVDEVVDPGSIVAFEHRWPSEWKAEARELRDHRTPREPTPQYANDSDRDAAIARHGEQARMRRVLAIRV